MHCCEPCYAFCSVDFWLLHGCKQAWSDPQPTHAPIKKPAQRKISWTDQPRVYHNAQVYLAYTTTRRQNYVSGSRRCSGSSRRLPASSRTLSLHTLPSRQLGMWEISWIDYASRENHAQGISVASYRHEEHRERCAARRTNNLHNSIRRPKSTPRSCAPECFTQTVEAESAGDRLGPSNQAG